MSQTLDQSGAIYAVHCACGRRIEGCDGLHGDWKHSATNAEHCADGDLATPEQQWQRNRRLYEQTSRSSKRPVRTR